MPRNLITGKVYRGINLFLLNMANYTSPYWLTYNQCKERGGCVKAGEKATPIVFWKFDKKEEEEGEGKKAPLLRYYNVFNSEQCEGLNIPQLEAEVREFAPIEVCMTTVAAMPNAPEIRHGDQKAYYVPSMDYVNMPKPETFTSAEEYYSVLFHQLTHSAR